MHVGVSCALAAGGLQPQDLALVLEERGFESLFVPDHSHGPIGMLMPDGSPAPYELVRDYLSPPDPFVALAAAASVTTRLVLGTAVCLVVQRDPIQTAKIVSSLDGLSGGRFVFGVGIGWNRPEIENHGTAFSARLSVMRERILAMKAIWTCKEPSFAGRHVSFAPIWQEPKPLQEPHPPILVGGESAQAIERVIDYGDGWMPYARYGLTPASLAPSLERLKRRADEVGRAMPEVTVCAADPRDLDAYAELGVARALIAVDSDSPDAMRALIDDLAERHLPARA